MRWLILDLAGLGLGPLFCLLAGVHCRPYCCRPILRKSIQIGLHQPACALLSLVWWAQCARRVKAIVEFLLRHFTPNCV